MIGAVPQSPDSGVERKLPALAGSRTPKGFLPPGRRGVGSRVLGSTPVLSAVPSGVVASHPFPLKEHDPTRGQRPQGRCLSSLVHLAWLHLPFDREEHGTRER